MAMYQNGSGPAAAATTAPPQKPRRKRRKRRKRRRPMSIAAVCRAAAQEGVSYGVYVLRHGV